MRMLRLGWSAVAALVLMSGPGLRAQTPPALSATWERGGIVRLKEGARVSRLNVKEDIVGCLGQLFDPTTGERFGSGEGTGRVLDVATNQGRRFLLLSAAAAANCNVQGQCGAAAWPNVTLIWMEIAADLSVVRKQTFAIIDCRAPRWVDGAPDDWADTFGLANGALRIAFVESSGPADVHGVASYDHKTPERGISVSGR